MTTIEHTQINMNVTWRSGDVIVSHVTKLFPDIRASDTMVEGCCLSASISLG